LASIVAAILVFTQFHPGNASPKAGWTAAEGAFSIDGPTMLSWLLILVLTLFGVLLFAERRPEGGVTAFAGQAAAIPGTEAEREASTLGLE
uniref:hypothetical protein n=1 Tax=Methylobacterium nigriterrae TaxID=3127512 RepID=UPI003013ACDC